MRVLIFLAILMIFASGCYNNYKINDGIYVAFNNCIIPTVAYNYNLQRYGTYYQP